MSGSGENGGGRLVAEIRTIYERAKEKRRPIEEKWNRNRDYFNREIASALRKGEGTSWRSDITPNLTKQKVMTALSTLLSYYMPDGEVPFACEPWEASEDPVRREDENRAAARSQELIRSQFKQCQAAKTARKFAFSCCLYGWAAYQLDLFERVEKRWKKSAGGFADHSGVNPENVRWIDETARIVQPGVRHASIWNCFWDVESDDPNEGTFLIHRVPMPARRLRQMAQANPDLYSLTEVDAALEQGGGEVSAEDDGSLPPNLRGLSDRTHDQFVVEFHGWLERSIVEEFEKDWEAAKKADAKKEKRKYSDAWRSDDEGDGSGESQICGDEIHVAAAMLNGRIVMYARSSPADRPIRFGRFEVNSDETGAQGVADNVEHDMKALTGLMRSAMDNAMLSGDVMFAVREGDIDSPFDRIEPGARIELSPDCLNVNQAIQQLRVAPTTAATVELIRVLVQQAEDNSMMPRVATGLSSMQSRVTATQIRQQMGQFEQTIGQFSALMDECFTEPTVEWFYQCNMLDPSISNERKGSWRILAKGYANFKSASDSIVKMDSLFAFLLSNPELAAEAKPRQMAIDKGRELRIDAERYLLSPEEKREKAEMTAKMQQADPMVQLNVKRAVEEVRAIEAKTENMLAQAEAVRVKAETSMREIKLRTAEFLARLESGRDGQGARGGQSGADETSGREEGAAA